MWSARVVKTKVETDPSLQTKITDVRDSGIHTFQPGGPGGIPAWSKILISILGLGVSFVCVISGGEFDILLTIDSGRTALVLLASVLVHSWLPLQASDPRPFGF